MKVVTAFHRGSFAARSEAGRFAFAFHRGCFKLAGRGEGGRFASQSAAAWLGRRGPPLPAAGSGAGLPSPLAELPPECGPLEMPGVRRTEGGAAAGLTRTGRSGGNRYLHACNKQAGGGPGGVELERVAG